MAKGGDRIVALARDISERKQTAERHREGAQHLQMLWQAIDASPVTIVITDRLGCIEYVNPQFTAATGYSREEAVGRNPRILKSNKTPAAVYKSLWSTLDAGNNWCGELCNRRKNGTLFWESAIISPVKDEGGKIVKFIAIKENITERKMAEAELLDANRKLESATTRANEMAARAERANGAKSEFLTNMSHEIRTPLNGVIGMTALLLNTGLTGDQRGYAEILRASGASLLNLVNDILDLSKIEANKLGLETLDFDLSEMLDEFTDSLAVRAHEKGLELMCSVEHPVPTLLRGDPGRLRQVLNNLAGNAVKLHDRGEIAVGVSLIEEDPAGALLRLRCANRDRHRTGEDAAALRQVLPAGRLDLAEVRRHRPRPGHLEAADPPDRAGTLGRAATTERGRSFGSPRDLPSSPACPRRGWGRPKASGGSEPLSWTITRPAGNPWLRAGPDGACARLESRAARARSRAWAARSMEKTRSGSP